MTRTIAMIAVAGIAGSAFGQGFSLSASSNSVTPGDVVTITMNYDDAGRVIAGGIWNMNADGGAATIGAWNFAGAFVGNGTPNGGSLENVRYLQLPTFGTPTNGDVFSYTWSAAAEGTYTINLEGINVTTAVSGENATAPTQVDGSVTIEVVPPPASAAVLGLGGLVAARRRR